MRADRLVAVLLLVQRRGRVTAAEVAAELEVSERTARRDLDALSVAGLPIYSRQGRNGGWELLGGATTDLSGLSADEVRALFLVAGPASATPAVAAALRKLVRALPEPFRDRAEIASSSVVVDQRGWGGGQPRRVPPLLDVVQRAVIESSTLQLSYRDRERIPSTRVVEPLGLASKQGTWYLIAGTDAGRRTFRLDRMIEAEPTGDTFDRPTGFDLHAEWAAVTEGVARFKAEAELVADVAAAPEAMPFLRYSFGGQLRVGPTRTDGRIDVGVSGQSLPSLAANLAGFGGLIEVLEPAELRARLLTIGTELIDVYGARGSD